MSLYNDLAPLPDENSKGGLAMKRYANYAPPPTLLKAGMSIFNIFSRYYTICLPSKWNYNTICKLVFPFRPKS